MLCGETCDWKRCRWLTQLFVFGVVSVAGSLGLAQSPSDVDCPVITRLPGQRVLLIMAGGDIPAAEETCRANGLAFDIGQFEPQRQDYSEYHLISVGSNAMDFWGGSPELKRPEAFEHLEAYVRKGGHLLVFNTFNGRNLEHLSRFGIRPYFLHASRYVRVPELTDILFAGSESLIPEGDYLAQAGNFSVSQPHVVLLRRGKGSDEGGPCVVTIPVDQGRVTYTSVEPYYGKPPGYWMIGVMLNWAARGGPVVAGPTQPIVYDRRPPLPSEAAMNAAVERLRENIGAELPETAGPKELSARAKIYRDALNDETDRAARFILLKLATETFARAGEPASTTEMLDRWTDEFSVPRHQVTLTSLRLLSKHTPATKLNEVLRLRALEPIDDALTATDLETARSLIQLALETAQATRHRRWISVATAEDTYVNDIGPAAETVKSALERLQTAPSDQEAARQAGEYYCFALRNWQRGLYLLAQGDDEELKNAAVLDLADPQSGDDRERAGDAWAALAKSAVADVSPAMMQRAAYWYSLAMDDLTGIRRTGVQQKLLRNRGPAFTLRISASRLASGTSLSITPTEISCSHSGSGGLPERITLGDLSWVPETAVPLTNNGFHRVIPRDVQLSSARIDKVRAKGEATIVTATEQELVLNFEHSGDQRLPYEVTLKFGAD